MSLGGIWRSGTGFNNVSRSGTMEPSSKTIKELEARHGNEIENLFDIKPAALTQSESQYLLGFRTTDELRNRVAKARLERQDRLFEKGVSKSPPNSVATDGEAQFSRSAADTKVERKDAPNRGSKPEPPLACELQKRSFLSVKA